MTRGVTTLGTMVQNLRYETGRSPNTNIGQDEYASLVYLLQRTQRALYWDFEWPFLKVRRDLSVVAGSRYYDVDDDLDYERILRVRGNGNGVWTPLMRGITMEDYNIFDSDDDSRSSPAQKWDIIDTDTDLDAAQEQLEIWPLCETAETVRFEGFKKLGNFTSDNHTCTLDDTLIVLFAAAELLAADESPRAKPVLNAANNMYRRMRGGAEHKEGNFVIMGSRAPAVDPYKAPHVIAVHDS